MFEHQFNAHGSHRIIQVDRSGRMLAASGWVAYQNFAGLKVGKKSLIAVTDYFSGGVLEPGKNYAVRMLNSEERS